MSVATSRRPLLLSADLTGLGFEPPAKTEAMFVLKRHAIKVSYSYLSGWLWSKDGDPLVLQPQTLEDAASLVGRLDKTP